MDKIRPIATAIKIYFSKNEPTTWPAKKKVNDLYLYLENLLKLADKGASINEADVDELTDKFKNVIKIIEKETQIKRNSNVV